MHRTYKTAFDFASAFPELLPKTTVRLHPRRGAVDDPKASKMGGEIAWPDGEPWPACEIHGRAPYVAVLQLRADDVPELGFPEGEDLFQLLWCPHDHESAGGAPLSMVKWRSAADLHALAPNPAPAPTSESRYLCEPCNVAPERVVEYPPGAELDLDQLEAIAEWLNAHAAEDLQALGLEPDDPEDPANYEHHFSVAQGTKVGGHVKWIQSASRPECTCGRPMDHLVTVASAEWDGAWERWLPMDERHVRELSRDQQRALQCAADLMLGDMGNYHVFICRACPSWPTWPVFQCS